MNAYFFQVIGAWVAVGLPWAIWFWTIIEHNRIYKPEMKHIDSPFSFFFGGLIGIIVWTQMMSWGFNYPEAVVLTISVFVVTRITVFLIKNIVFYKPYGYVS